MAGGTGRYENLKARTKAFAVATALLSEELPKRRNADVIARQLMRCGTSVGANYRAASRAKSPADFVAKMGIVEEEADECVYWMELAVEMSLLPYERCAALMREANELTAIAVASIRTARERKEGGRNPR